jgi:mannose/fructose-specific phosphotransferase system component IIA
MTEALQGLVVAHGRLATALIGAAEDITGVQGALIAVSNADCDRARLEERVRGAVGDRPTIVFVDLPTGSCFFAVMHGLGTLPNVRLVTGVNLTMLVDFVFHRQSTLEEAAARARDVGGRAIAGR